ncbi:FUSC family protein [Actinocorallia sp. A-T 12471]|uniref:FUSC family protein n=1 Tax=Actinocorallia sp. A-T 12471 TaxID=3089813 RepID=UPI0029D0953C|nr:FUSC family protein [Actinocorallia sp. A-T 12471]MDX6740427.1 FUSC family protein [Actinocorallia sp. A-T 12471]
MATGGVRTDTRGWIGRAFSWSDAPPSRAEAVCAALAFGTVIALSRALGDAAAGLFMASGIVLAAVRADTGVHRTRVLATVVPQLSGAVGLVIGQLSHGRGWGTVAVTTLVALGCGLASPIGKIVSTSALSLLFLDATGTGIPAGEQWWVPPLLQVSGGMLYLLFVVVSWRLPGGAADPGTRVVAEVYTRIADLIASPVHPGDAAAALSDAVDRAEDTLVRHQIPAAGRRDPETRWLIALLNCAGPLMEAASVLVGSAQPAPRGVAEAVREIGEAVRAGRRDADLPDFGDDPVFADAVAGASRALRGDYADEPRDAALPDPLPRRAGEAVRTVLTSATSWRYGFRLALCMGVAAAVVQFQILPRFLGIASFHSFWVPLTVAIVMKPDLGSVFVRALLRAAGTVAAAVPTLLLLVVVPRGWAAVPLAAFLGALIPLFKGRSYAMRAVTVTPMMLFLLDTVSSAPPGELVAARLADTVLGCAIVLVFGYALWPRSWRVRPRERVSGALDLIADYLEEVFTAPRAVRGGDRRRLHRVLDGLRARIDQMLAEPPPASRAGAAWRPVVLGLEGLATSVTAASVRAERDRATPSRGEVARVAAEIRETADAVRTGRELPDRADALPVGVLCDVVGRVRAVRAAVPR